MYNCEYINCRVCGKDLPKFLGIRGNREYAGAAAASNIQEHMATNVVRCKNCGFVYTNPFIAVKTAPYNDFFDYAPSSSGKPERLFSFILDLVEKYTGKGKMLDIGCGKGEFLYAAQKRDWETYGVEPSINFAKFAKETYGLNIDSAPPEKTRYPDNHFDVVTLNMVLEHVDNPGELLSHVKRLLKDKGLLFIEVPNTDSLTLKSASLYFRFKGKGWSPLLSPLHKPFHCYGYNIPSIKYLLDTQGFKVQKLFVSNSTLRGFRPDAGGSRIENFFRDFIAGLGGFMGRGDALIVIARKKNWRPDAA